MTRPSEAAEHHETIEEIAADTVAGIGRRAALLRLAVLAAIIIAGFVAILATGGISSDRVRDWVDGVGSDSWGPVVFIASSALLTVCLFPGPLLAAASGLLFGTAVGFPVAVASAIVGASLAFTLSRTIAHDAVEHLQGPRLSRLRDWVGERGFVSVLTARLLPGIPYNSVNYAAGLTPIALPAFVAATAIGTAPRTYAYVALGGRWGDWTSPPMLIALTVLVLTSIGGVIFARTRPKPPPDSSEGGR